MARIFISYKRVDKDKVFPIVEEIKHKTGVDCWIDLEGIESGDQFQNVIIDAIDNADIVIFMLSKNFIAPYKDEKTGKIDLKKQAFPEKEVMYALNEGKRLIPLSIDGTTVNDCKWLKFNCSGLDCILWNNSDQRNKFCDNIKHWFGNQSHKDSQTHFYNQNEKDSLVGTVVYGHNDIFRIVELVGKGRTGKVYKSYSVNTNIEYAIKKLDIDDLSEYLSISWTSSDFHRKLAQDELNEWRNIFKKTSLLIKNVQHKNLAKIFDYTEDLNGNAFCIMEYVNGMNLNDYIMRNPISEEESINIIKDICEALKCLHKIGILHLDVKPSNIVYNPITKHTTLIDYSTSLCFLQEQNISKIWVTELYIPFDISNHINLVHNSLNESVDTYSVAATLFTLLTNKLPPSGLDMRVVKDSLDYPLSVVQSPQSLISFIKHAMSDDPKKRFQRIEDMLYEIEKMTSLSNYPKYPPLTEKEIIERTRRASTTVPL